MLMKIEFFQQIFKKYSKIFMKIRLVGVELSHADGRTDGHGEANDRYSQFCERALKNPIPSILC